MGLLAALVDIFANVAQLFLLVLGMFLILVVLLQRGRGGGLAGAFGGAGGQSAFGTKAGDVFTKITIGIAVLWVITNGVSGMLIRASQSAISETLPGSDEDEDGPEVSPGDSDSGVPEAPELEGTGDEDAATTGAEGEDGGEVTPDADAASDADANAPDSPQTPETGTDPADTNTDSIDAADDEAATDEAVAPETADAAPDDAGAEEATESTAAPSTDSAEGNSTAPESSDEITDGATDSGDGAANPPN